MLLVVIRVVSGFHKGVDIVLFPVRLHNSSMVRVCNDTVALCTALVMALIAALLQEARDY